MRLYIDDPNGKSQNTAMLLSIPNVLSVFMHSFFLTVFLRFFIFLVRSIEVILHMLPTD